MVGLTTGCGSGPSEDEAGDPGAEADSDDRSTGREDDDPMPDDGASEDEDVDEPDTETSSSTTSAADGGGGPLDETTGGLDDDTNGDGSSGGAEDSGIGMSGDFPLLSRPWPDGPDPAVADASSLMGQR